MTTNVGSQQIQKTSSLGFGNAEDSAADYERIKERVMEESKRTFKPEFLNRINDLIIFRPLTRDDISKILDIELGNVMKRLASRELKLTLTDKAKNFLIDHGYDEKYGARPLKRAIERYLEDPLAEEILRGNLQKEKPITVDAELAGLVFHQGEPKSPVPVKAVKAAK
jgi:ATP-dependent Clp protease ATP-binding subunit ClpC